MTDQIDKETLPATETAVADAPTASESAESSADQRRSFLKGAGALGALTALGVLSGCDDNKKKRGSEETKEPTPTASASAAPAAGSSKITWKVQTAWDAGTVGFAAFEKFARSISELSGGKLEIEPQANNALAKTFDLFAAVKSGDVDAMHSFPIYWVKDMPVCAFLCSYPLGMDRPDQWETWYYELGGLDLARKAYEANNIHFVGMVQHDLNLIHSKVPIRSFEDFKKKKIRFPGGLIGDVFKAAGVDVATFPGGKVYGALKDGQVEAADFTGPAVNFNLGFADVAKYIIMGPPSTPCLHQPCDLMEFSVNLKKWQELSPALQGLFTAAVRKFSWDHYAYIQRENVKAWGKFREKGVEVIRLTETDVGKFRKIAVPLWFQWAKKDPLATTAFKSQIEFMRSDNIAYVNDAMLVDEKGQKLTI
ncbi:MAG: substrate-binding domain-containing protein [Polyangiaceae bacterium]